jgi:citrate lyase subunit beta / citryl-CoA lyase
MKAWRSLQYVPAHIWKYVASPHIAAADGVVLDLEDAVPPAEKAAARAALAADVAHLAPSGRDILVRINAEAPDRDADIRAAAIPGVTALVAPKCRDAEDVRALDAAVGAAEAATGLAAGSIKIVGLIETAEGFLNLREIAGASRRMVALGLGNEDFAADVGMTPDEDTLTYPRQHLCIVAAAHGLAPLGLIGSATNFGDLEGLRRIAERSRRFGFVGSTCIHPSQIAVLNAAFGPTADEVAWAVRVVDAADAAEREGRGAVALEGRMIDAPIVARARRTLSSMSFTNPSNEQTSL